MEISTDLVVKIIVLLTAVVGLYKATQFDAAKPFLEQVFGYLSLLAMPAFILVFYWLFTTTTDMMGSSSEIVIDNHASEAAIMYKLSQEIWNQGKRQEALHLVIEKAMATGQYDVLAQAAAELNPTSQSDPVLMEAIEQLAGTDNLPGAN